MPFLFNFKDSAQLIVVGSLSIKVKTMFL